MLDESHLPVDNLQRRGDLGLVGSDPANDLRGVGQRPERVAKLVSQRAEQNVLLMIGVGSAVDAVLQGLEVAARDSARLRSTLL